MSPPEVIVIDTGCANLASVLAALSRVGARARVSLDPASVSEAPLMVLPGVGAFGPAMKRLRAHGLDGPIIERVRVGRALLAICLGMQLLCNASQESPGIQGLGVIPDVLTRFDGGCRVPQMGWNRVRAGTGATLLRPSAMYYANSYRLKRIPRGWEGATSDHGGRFVAALQRDSVLCCQFHPELSGRDGLDLIGRWLSFASEGLGVSC
jgi:imidazole glycerol phosphate synthase glutamine amidotransferase subunit